MAQSYNLVALKEALLKSRTKRKSIQDEKPISSSSFSYAVYIISSPEGTAPSSNVSSKAPLSSNVPGGFGLQLLESSLEIEDETQLRSFLSARLSKGIITRRAISISPMDFRLDKDEETPASCFSYWISLDETEFIFCLLTDGPGLLDIFSADLVQFVTKLVKKVNSKNPKLTAEVKSCLCSWSDINIHYLSRCLQQYGTDVAILFQAALSDVDLEVVGSDSSVKEDVEKFIQACSVKELLSDFMPLCDMTEKEKVRLEVSKDQVKCSSSLVGSGYASKWSRIMLNIGPSDPLKLREAVNDFRMHVIKDVNFLKREVTQADEDYYALYRAYRYLRESGNSSFLLQSLEKEEKSIGGNTAVLTLLGEYLTDKGYL